MMKIKTKGSNKAVRKLVELATSYYAEKLMGKRTINNLEINIDLKRNLTKDTGCEGTSIWEDESPWPKEFLIELDSSEKIRNLLITLAHEMVHVKQWAKNEMHEYCKPDEVRFNKIKFNMTEIDYWDYPWEIEAFGRQLGLFIRFCEDNGLSDREDMMEEA